MEIEAIEDGGLQCKWGQRCLKEAVPLRAEGVHNCVNKVLNRTFSADEFPLPNTSKQFTTHEKISHSSRYVLQAKLKWLSLSGQCDTPNACPRAFAHNK